MYTDPGGASSLNGRRHVTAHLQVSRVFGDGRCALLRHEFSTRQHLQSHGPKQKGECGCVYIASFSAYLIYIINYTSLFSHFLGCDSCISKQCVHTPLKHQRTQPGIKNETFSCQTSM